MAVKIEPFVTFTVMPERAVALKTSPDLALVMVTRMPLMLPPLPSKVNAGARAVSWLEIVASVPVLKVGKNQRLAFESVWFWADKARFTLPTSSAMLPVAMFTRSAPVTAAGLLAVKVYEFEVETRTGSLKVQPAVVVPVCELKSLAVKPNTGSVNV